MTTIRLFDRIDPAPVLAAQRDRRVNFDSREVDASWSHDRQSTVVGREPPGPPEPGGVWETACRLVADYEMADPAIIRAVYDPTVPLEGRDMVLEGRFLALRFYMGVRVTSVVDEQQHGAHSWGWAYETLEGHLERGRMSYMVIKHDDSGEVEFVISAYSEHSPRLNPVLRLGWMLFGRRHQLRFYRQCGRRMVRLVHQHRSGRRAMPQRLMSDGLVLAPSDARGTG